MDGASLVPDLPLFKAEADRAVRVFNRLRIPDVIGKPTMAEAAGEWLRDIVRAVFGAYDPATNERMLQEAFVLVPKKNSKTSGAASIMLTAIILNRRPEAEGLLIAPTKDVADRSFKQIAGTIRADPELIKVFHIQQHIRKITHIRTGATIEVKASDTDVITGAKATYILIDETHVFAAKSKASDIFVEIRGALTARPDGFLIQITTQSKDPPAGVFKVELANARDVRDGKLDLPLLPILYELPEAYSKDGGWENENYWSLVNPNLGRSVNVAFLRREVLKAKREGPEKIRLIASQHFNVQVGSALRTDRWPGAEFWEKRADPDLTLEELLLRCEVVVVGVDGGGLDDLFGLAVLGRDRETRHWLCWSRAWAHTSVLERRPGIVAQLRDFEKAGELTIVDDKLEDVSEIVDLIAGIRDRGLLGGVGVDPAGLGELVEGLAAEEITQEDGGLVGVPQGFGLMAAIKTAERKLANGTFVHSGSSLAAWCVANLKIEPTATAVRATKQNAGDAKIDVAMAQFNAVFLLSRNPEPLQPRSVYEDRPLLIV
ncbi:terminase large subunit [Methylobacterium platani]|uniref:Terminase n=2 Tax=Methylobacterium platani TaxID=427683 RepID=A0A179SIA4_9HYPH|nr:terminase large subunit [Methylobacterium platani]OAS26293.1 terminase [Methylobacterium platani]